MRAVLLALVLVACGDNIEPQTDAGPCGAEFPPVPDAACAGVYQLDVHTCTWSCSTFGFDAGVQAHGTEGTP